MPATSTDRLYGLTTSVAVKPPVQISADVNVITFGEQTITTTTFTGTRTVTTTTGMRILLTNQNSDIDNGIWEARPASWVRAPDFDGARDAVNGSLVFSIYGDCWQVEATDPVRIGYDPINFRSTYPFSPDANLFQRSLRIPEAYIPEMPPLDQMEGKLVAIAGGRPIGVLPESGSASDVLIELAKPTGCGLIGYRKYTVQDRLDEEISIASIVGVDPTGSSDSTLAINNFLALLNTNSTKTVVRFPPGTYLVSGLNVPNNSLVIKGSGMYAYGEATTKLKAAAANTTIMTLSGSGCSVENFLFEGFEATTNFGAGETCVGLKIQSSTGSADIDSFVINNCFFNLKNGVIGYGRNVTHRFNLFSHVAFPIDLNYVSGQQFRGHVIDDNRFHSCGAQGAATSPSLANSVCIKMTVNPASGTLADNYAGNISIRNNKVDGGCYQFFLGPLHRGSILSNNDILRCGGASAIVIKIDNTQTVANTDYEAIIISNNVIASDIPIAALQGFPDYALWMTAVRGAVVNGNDFSKLGKHGIVLDNCADILIGDTQLKNPNMNVSTNGVVFNAIDIANGGNNIQILGLNVRCTQANPQIQYVVNNASATNVMVDNVMAGNYQGMLNEGGSARTHGIINFGSNRRKEVFATTTAGIPSNINYAVGDICWFTAPPATGAAYSGALCVTAGVGAAAVWRNFGALV